jgi:pimeloyl-ACP methyl ester carboxylesterase
VHARHIAANLLNVSDTRRGLLMKAVLTALAAGALAAAITVPVVAHTTPETTTLTSYAQGLSAYQVKLKWGSCPASVAKAPFQCATAPAPLNYAKPAGTRISLELIRLPAADPKERIGSLFINFGGPGGAGTTILPERATTVFSAAIRDHFDLVSWDTRGTGLSTAVRCFPTQQDDTSYFNSVPYFPYPASTDASFWSLSAELGKACEQQAGSLLPHMSSQDTARDLDLLRQDVGDAKLNYMGFSYGTVIGAIYANLFPTKVRAMVLDGTADPKGNAVGDASGDATKYPVDVRNGIDAAGRDVLGRFLSLCAKAGSAKCAFAAGGNLLGKWQTILTRAKANPITYNGGTYFYDTIVAVAYYNLYKPMAEWPGLGTLLQGLYTASTPAVLHAAAQEAYPVNNGNEGYDISQCADISVPTKESVYDNLAVTENAKVPDFGYIATYDMTMCATWPALNTDAYDGPWNKSKATILVINSLHDPATPYQGAVAAVRELGNARLLTVNGDGHTSEYSEPSTCRDTDKQAYLISLQLPRQGTVCQVNQLPWGLPPGS